MSRVRSLRRAAGVLGALVLASAGADADAGSGAGAGAGSGSGAAVASRADQPLKECRVDGLRNSVLCGVVQRPLDPARPDGLAIDVHYVVVPALARRKLPDPVFLLAGGPGQSAVSLAANAMGQFSRLNNRRDIVFVDQRGTGRSAPLMCDDARHLPLAVQADPARQLQDLQQCRLRLQQLPHGDLRFYTTTLAMQDLDAVRRQLGAERINLVGASYGTRAALEYQRAFPQAVRRSVLDGVAPPDMALPDSGSADAQAALDALLAACAEQPGCRRDHPNLRREWQSLLAGLPRPAQVAHPLTGQVEALTITRDMVLSAVRGPLYVPAYAAALPAAIGAARQGRFEPLLGLSALLGSRRSQPLAMGMHHAVICSEDLPRMARVAAAVPDGARAAEVPLPTAVTAVAASRAPTAAPRLAAGSAVLTGFPLPAPDAPEAVTAAYTVAAEAAVPAKPAVPSKPAVPAANTVVAVPAANTVAAVADVAAVAAGAAVTAVTAGAAVRAEPAARAVPAARADPAVMPHPTAAPAVSALPVAVAADFGVGFALQYRRACADWPRGAVPAEFYTVPAARSPVLLLSGGLDPATPPRHGARVAAALGPLARHVVVANGGHGVMGIGCMRDVLYRFIDAADAAAALAVDTGCAASIPRPPVFEPVGSTAASP